MDKLIYTAFNTLNNIYDNRSVRAQNMANINVPGYRRDLGTKSVGSAFMSAENTFQARALAIRDDTNISSLTRGHSRRLARIWISRSGVMAISWSRALARLRLPAGVI